MEALDVLLKLPARRRRQALAHYFEALSLYLEAGLDIGYAWPQARLAVASQLGPLQSWLFHDGESVAASLDRLAKEYPERAHAVWFSVIAELYQRGAGLRAAVEAAARTLREEHQRELDAHCRQLPVRTNIVLLLFFLPPTLLLLFAPLLAELAQAF